MGSVKYVTFYSLEGYISNPLTCVRLYVSNIVSFVGFTIKVGLLL